MERICSQLHIGFCAGTKVLLLVHQVLTASLMISTPGGGGGVATAIYGLYRYVPL